MYMLQGLTPNLILHPNIQYVSDFAIFDSIFLALTIAPESVAFLRQAKFCVTLFILQSFISLSKTLTLHMSVYTVL